MSERNRPDQVRTSSALASANGDEAAAAKALGLTVAALRKLRRHVAGGIPRLDGSNEG